jgi:sugar lactone lactonase YvrE
MKSPGSAFHGVHGLGIDKAGRMFAGSVAGAALYEVDRDNGAAKIAIPTPEGMADDIAFAPDGTMAWTGFLTGDLYSRKDDGPIKKLASGLPGINSLAYRKDGRLGKKTILAKDLKMPEGVALAPDGKLIVAEVGAKRLVELDPQTGKLTEIAGNLPIGLVGAPGGLPTNIPTGVGVGATGTIYFSSDIENAIYKVVKK